MREINLLIKSTDLSGLPNRLQNAFHGKISQMQLFILMRRFFSFTWQNAASRLRKNVYEVVRHKRYWYYW